MLVCFAQCVFWRWKESSEELPGFRKYWIPYAICVLVLCPTVIQLMTTAAATAIPTWPAALVQ